MGRGRGPHTGGPALHGERLPAFLFPSSNSFSRNTGWGGGLGRKGGLVGSSFKVEKSPAGQLRNGFARGSYAGCSHPPRPSGASL